MDTINLLMLILSGGFILFTLANMIYEKETRATIILTVVFILNTLLWLYFHLSPLNRLLTFVNILLLALIGVFTVIAFVPAFRKKQQTNLSRVEPFDERDIMFARNNLKRFPELYNQYYEKYPDRKERDAKIHSRPDLSDPSMSYHHPYFSPLFDSAFDILDIEKRIDYGDPHPEKSDVDPAVLTSVLTFIAKTYGAVDLGVCELKPHHFYSHKGREADDWGREISNSHRFGISIVVPMEIAMIKEAPSVYAIVESSKAYIEAAKIAKLIAHYLKSLGYDSKAHTDGNYETVCVPIAVDAGVGELSRMGLIIHRTLGPSVRISIVTSDAPLISTSSPSQHIDAFCRICKKCADNCPTRSIPDGKEPESRGVPHWHINQESCFQMWKQIGTDCGFCLRVCPYTKPDTLFHRLVRFYISRNGINQRIALLFDDLLFGRKFKMPVKNRCHSEL